MIHKRTGSTKTHQPWIIADSMLWHTKSATFQAPADKTIFVVMIWYAFLLCPRKWYTCRYNAVSALFQHRDQISAVCVVPDKGVFLKQPDPAHLNTLSEPNVVLNSRRMFKKSTVTTTYIILSHSTGPYQNTSLQVARSGPIPFTHTTLIVKYMGWFQGYKDDISNNIVFVCIQLKIDHLTIIWQPYIIATRTVGSESSITLVRLNWE